MIDELKEVLKEKGISQRQFALQIGVGADAVCNWFQNKRKPSRKYQAIIESFLNENKNNKHGRNNGDKISFTERIRGHIDTIFKRNASS